MPDLAHWHCSCCGTMVVPGTKPLMALKDTTTGRVTHVPIPLGCVQRERIAGQPHPAYLCGKCSQLNAEFAHRHAPFSRPKETPDD